MNSNTNKLNILYQSDDNYAPYLGVSLLSLLASNKEAPDIDIYIIADDISDENILKLKKTTEHYGRKLIVFDAKALQEKAAESGFTSYMGFRKNKMSYLKMFVEYVVPKDADRLLYIDSDTLVRGDLTQLMSIPMHDHPIGMVQDCLMSKCKHAVGIGKGEPYFNSGVILFDMKQWRDKHCLERIVDHACNVRVYGTVDQDFYNVVLKGDIEILPAGYNLQGMYLAYKPERFDRIFKQDDAYYSAEEIAQARKNPAIIHFLRFMGEYPLSKGSIHPVQKLFDKYLEKSLWKDMQRSESNLSLTMKIERMLYRILPQELFLRIFKIFHDRMISNAEKESRTPAKEAR
ncbi:MAG: hypothetical protein IJM34_08530 [Lachnospiraceae bacterium]|nr:hypothetical protein [Lachnospiraceae bacterium]